MDFEECFLAKSPLPATTAKGRRSIVIGVGSSGDFDNCLIFGDDLFATKNDQVLIGDEVFGKAIPADVRYAIAANSEAFKFFTRAIFAPSIGWIEAD